MAACRMILDVFYILFQFQHLLNIIEACGPPKKFVQWDQYLHDAVIRDRITEFLHSQRCEPEPNITSFQDCYSHCLLSHPCVAFEFNIGGYCGTCNNETNAGEFVPEERKRRLYIWLDHLDHLRTLSTPSTPSAIHQSCTTPINSNTSKCYWLHTETGLSRVGAATECENQGGRLVSIKTPAIDTFLSNNSINTHYAWLSLQRFDEQWLWGDGTEVELSLWPANGLANGDCSYFYTTPSSALCSYINLEMKTICESY